MDLAGRSGFRAFIDATFFPVKEAAEDASRNRAVSRTALQPESSKKPRESTTVGKVHPCAMLPGTRNGTINATHEIT
jgi:hypothetical protein